jgi:hypothetical protein
MRYETETGLTRGQIFEAAKKHFLDEAGPGMKLGAEQGAQIQFFGNGLVWLTVWPGPPAATRRRVDIDVSERDADARRFIAKVLRAPVEGLRS